MVLKREVDDVGLNVLRCRADILGTNRRERERERERTIFYLLTKVMDKYNTFFTSSPRAKNK